MNKRKVNIKMSNNSKLKESEDNLIYLVFENSRSGPVKGACISRELAERKIKESNGELMNYIQTIELEK